MSLRRRVGLVAASAVGIALVIAAVVCYIYVRGQLRGQVDSALRAQFIAVQHGDTRSLESSGPPGIPASAGGPAQYAELVFADGAEIRIQGDLSLPIDPRSVDVASTGAGTYMADTHVGANHLRVLVFPVSVPLNNGQLEPAALVLAKPLNGVDSVLSNLRLVLALLCLGGIAMAATLGRIAARRVLAPLAEVAETAQQIGETDDLSRRLRIHGDDEVGQLARRFNAMLESLEASRAALDESVRAQRQLVADASHELRTPVTSLRTNVEVLLAGGQLSDEDRERLLGDVVEQSEELSTLVADLIELARGDQPITSAEEVRLDRLVEQSVDWARRNASAVEFETALQPVIVDGDPARLERAVNNLLDNAARHSQPGGLVEVTVDRDGVRVRDHGEGVEEQDLPHVFDRFYRGANSRGRQGSGLGLAIVRQVAERHHGSVAVGNAPDGGAVFTIHLPTIPPEGDEPAAETAPVEPVNAQ
jgi:two-component system, OmpR family, sensor histidine kinase MprB